jgi:hypothetical protein
MCVPDMILRADFSRINIFTTNIPEADIFKANTLWIKGDIPAATGLQSAPMRRGYVPFIALRSDAKLFCLPELFEKYCFCRKTIAENAPPAHRSIRDRI